MGLRTDKCINPECDQRVRKGAKYCPKCGGGAPKGTVSCGSCGADIRSSAKFCSKCGADLAVSVKPKFDHNRWARQPEDFAIRIDVNDVKGWLVKPLIVEHGTTGLVFQSGRFAGELQEARYDVGGFLQRLTNFMIDSPASIVILDAGDVSIDLENDGLWTLDKFEVGAASRLVVHVQDPESLFKNLIKGRGQVTLDQLESQLASEVQMLLEGIVIKYRADQLFSSIDARYEIEAQLREHLRTTFSQFGLGLIQLRFIDFGGEAFEELRAKEGELHVFDKDIDLKDQRAQLARRLRDVLTTDKMDEFKSGKDLEDFILQIEHEMGLKDVIRKDEMARLKSRFEHESDREQLLRSIEIEAITKDALRDEARKQQLADEDALDETHRRESGRRVEKATTDAKIDDIKLDTRVKDHLQDKDEALFGQDLLDRMEDRDRKHEEWTQEVEAKRLAERSKATVEALLSIVDGPEGDRIAELAKLERHKDLSPEQILAITVEASPVAAQALAEKYKADGRLSDEMRELLEKRVAEQKETSIDHADRMERIMQTALHQMGHVAGTRARPVEPPDTIVTPGGGGAHVMVNSQSGTRSVACCCHCNAPLESDGNFCTACGKKQ